MKFAIAVLLGLATVQEVAAVQLARTHSLVQENSEMEFRPNEVQQPWSKKPEKPEERAKITKVTGALSYSDDGSEYYKRKMPEIYAD